MGGGRERRGPHQNSSVSHGSTMVTRRSVELTLGGWAESNTTKLTLKVVPTGADTLRHPLRPLSANSCPGHPRSRQLAGGQDRTFAVRLPSSLSKATAPGSHWLSAVGLCVAHHPGWVKAAP